MLGRLGNKQRAGVKNKNLLIFRARRAKKAFEHFAGNAATASATDFHVDHLFVSFSSERGLRIGRKSDPRRRALARGGGSGG